MKFSKNIALIFCSFSVLNISCTKVQTDQQTKKEKVESKSDHIQPALTTEQATAFAAFTTLQTSTDQQNRLFSTFPNIKQPCYPPDSNFIISRSELQLAMNEFVKLNCSYLDPSKMKALVAQAVLVQKEYKVLHCKEEQPNIDYSNGLPRKGIWVMPNVLNRSDITLVW